MECFRIYNADREYTGVHGIKGVTELKPGQFMLGSNLWLVNPDGKFLIQKRSMRLRTAPGKWAMTGGSVMLDETTKQAAVREMEEELGIILKEEELTFVESFTKAYFIVDVWIAKVGYIPEESMSLQSSEVQAAKWVTSEEIDEIVKNGNFMDTNWEAIKKFVAENM